MKIRNTILYILLLTGMWGCKKYLDVNENPNQTLTPPLNGLLAATTYNTAYNVYRTGNITSYFVQYLASPNANGATDTYESVDYSTTWKNLYDNMQDIRDMMGQAAAMSAFRHTGAGKVMMAINLAMVNDLWGSVPFREAFNPQTILQPAYDKDEDIYRTCLQFLDEGIADLTKTGSLYELDATKDLIHGGNAAAWVKTAYALKARLLTHLTKKGTYNAAQVQEALAKAYSSNADDAQLTRFQSLSPWNAAAVNNENNLLDGWMSDHSINALNGTTFGVFDPRIKRITDTTAFGDYRGTRNGKGRIGSGTGSEECYLWTKAFYSGSGAPLLIATYAECCFIAAEAAFRSGNKTAAYEQYLKGITANMDKLGIDVPSRTAYLGNPVVTPGATAISLDLILKEKYIALFLHPETWNDARRFDYKYKNFRMPENAQLETFIRRVAYPDTEKSRNGKNVPKVELTDKIWWDQ